MIRLPTCNAVSQATLTYIMGLASVAELFGLQGYLSQLGLEDDRSRRRGGRLRAQA